MAKLYKFEITFDLTMGLIQHRKWIMRLIWKWIIMMKRHVNHLSYEVCFMFLIPGDELKLAIIIEWFL